MPQYLLQSVIGKVWKRVRISSWLMIDNLYNVFPEYLDNSQLLWRLLFNMSRSYNYGGPVQPKNTAPIVTRTHWYGKCSGNFAGAKFCGSACQPFRRNFVLVFVPSPREDHTHVDWSAAQYMVQYICMYDIIISPSIHHLLLSVQIAKCAPNSLTMHTKVSRIARAWGICSTEL